MIFVPPSFVLWAIEGVAANAPIKDNKFPVHRNSRPNLGRPDVLLQLL